MKQETSVYRSIKIGQHIIVTLVRQRKEVKQETSVYRSNKIRQHNIVTSVRQERNIARLQCMGTVK